MRLMTTIGLITVIACRTDKSITVQNPAPKADIFSHADGDVVLEGFVTTFIGSVTDANHTPDQLTTIWYLDGDVVCEDIIPDEDGQTQCDITLGTENSEVTLAVLDTENARGETAVLVSVEATEAPIAQIVAPVSEGVYYSDQKIAFEGMISDAEDSPDLLTAFWESDIDGVLSNVDTAVDSAGAVIGYGYLSEGEHAVELHVEDSTGKTARETVIIDVGPPNSPPLCQIVSPLDDSAGPEGSVVTFEASAEDVDVAENTLTAEWSSDKDGVLGTSAVNTDGSITFPYSGLSVDTHVVTLTVEDEVEAACTSSVVFTVGTPPSVTIDSPFNGDVVNDGTPISFSATVSDAQDQLGDVSLEWVVNGNVISTHGATSTGEASFAYGALSYGTYSLVVTATDTDGLTDSDQVNFTINGLPSSPMVSINPNTPTTSNGLNVSIDSPSIDPEGVTPIYTYEWQLGGQAQTSYTSSSLPSSATSKGEQWTVVVTPNDGIADGVAGTTSVVIGNTAPSVGSVTVTPTGTVYNDDVLTCSATVSDPDETPTITYEWTIDGIVVGSSSTLDLSTTGSMPGDTVVCTVTATDSDVDSDSNSDSQTVSNRSPSIAASILTNGTNQNAELTCVGSATDPDGETPTVTYEWLNGSASLGSSNPLQLSSTLASSGDVIDCIATATDATGDTDTATVPHTVTNTIPVINAVTVTPNPATVGQDDLTCTVSASDADGDSLLYSYEWSDSTGIQQTTTLVSDTTDVFLANGVTEDTWTCEVTPYDGVDYGVSVNGATTAEGGCTSLSFDGGDTMGTNLTTSFTDITVEAWVRISNYGSSYMRIVDIDEPNQDYFTFGVKNTGVLVLILREGISSSLLLESPINIVDDQWHHVAWVRNGTTNILFLDGQETAIGTHSNFQFNPTVPLYIGSTHYSGGSSQYLSGLISGVRISEDVLYSTNFTPNTTFSNLSSTLLNLDVATSSVSDGSSYGHTVSNNGATWSTSCPEEDLDGDGYAAWEDCNDNDTTVADFGLGTSFGCAATSCKTILDDGYSTGDGYYWINPDGNGSFEVYCDMSTDGGGWTRVVNIIASSYDHAGTVSAVGNVSNLSTAAKLDDTLISLLNTQGYWWYECGTSKDVYVKTASGNFNSNYTNGEDWSIDNQKDGVFECSANRGGYVFADYPYCAAGHSDYGSPTDGTGCYVDGEGWGRSGALWAR